MRIWIRLYFNAELDLDPAPHQSDVRPRPSKAPFGTHTERVHGPPYSISVCFEPLQLLNSEFDADPDPTFQFDRVMDLDPASKTDRCRSGFCDTSCRLHAFVAMNGATVFSRFI
jgi:hypothetical protein